MGRRFHYDKTFYVSICASESDEQSYEDSDDDSEDSDDDSEDESRYDSDEDNDDEEEYEEYYDSDEDDDEDEDDETEEFSYEEEEEEEIEELVVLTRMKTKKKSGGASTSTSTTILSRKRKSCATKRDRRSSKTSAKNKVVKAPLKKKISKSNKGSLIRRGSSSSSRKKPAVATRNTKKDKEKAKSTIMRSMAMARYSSNNKKEDLENRPMTFLVFDLETTGLSRIHHRIIEIALVDPFHGGGNTTFHSLVNPDSPVSNSHIHHITTKMVTKPGVPRMHELIPNLLQFVKSRQKPRGCVVLVAHNARCFDVPFLVNEFKRCSKRIPSNWLFLDTLPLARQAMKSQGTNVVGASNLEALREHYGITLVGSAHRAMADVDTLSQVLQRIAFDLNLSTADLVQKTFTVRDLTLSKSKKNMKQKKKVSS